MRKPGEPYTRALPTSKCCTCPWLTSHTSPPLSFLFCRGMLERRQPRARGGDGYSSSPRASDPWDTGIVSMMEEDKGAIRKV
jgi:hypothetical protein